MRAGFGEYKKYTAEEQQRLLSALAEQLKIPLLQISKHAELSRSDQSEEAFGHINLIADHALQLMDHYLLSLQLQSLEEADLQPVSLSATLHATAHELHKFADLHHCDIRLDLAGQYEPVMAHPAGLAAALRSLASVFIEAQGEQSSKRGVVTLAAHRSRWGLVAGTYANTTGLNAEVFRRAKLLYGQARQPLNHMLAAPGAGVFVADSLFSNMATHLRPARHHKLNGLAATLQPVHQLSLV